MDGQTDRQTDGQTDVGHINLIGGLVTRNPPNNKQVIDKFITFQSIFTCYFLKYLINQYHYYISVTFYQIYPLAKPSDHVQAFNVFLRYVWPEHDFKGQG